jgi:hypothetical protein
MAKKYNVKRRPLMTGGKLTEELRPRNRRKDPASFRKLAEAHWKGETVTDEDPFFVPPKKVRSLPMPEAPKTQRPQFVTDTVPSGKREMAQFTERRETGTRPCIRCGRPLAKAAHPVCKPCAAKARGKRKKGKEQ